MSIYDGLEQHNSVLRQIDIKITSLINELESLDKDDEWSHIKYSISSVIADLEDIQSDLYQKDGYLKRNDQQECEQKVNKVKIFNDISGVMNSKPYNEKAVTSYKKFVENNNIEVIALNMNEDLSTVVLTYI